MALFTKLFDRSNDPYSIPGARWYKIRLYNDGSAEGDLYEEGISASTSYTVVIENGYTIINAMAYMKGNYIGSASTGAQLTVYVVHYPDGRDGVRILNVNATTLASNYDEGFEIYFYAIRKSSTIPI